jgi:hypothetical protein
LILLVFVAAIALLDGWQQHSSNRALAELARLSAPQAHGRRAGVALELAANQLERGDLLRLEQGDRVAADARAALALALAFWPTSPLELRRSLVFSLLLLTSGSLVWLNGDRASRLSAIGAALGVGLWLALLTIPGLMRLLSLAPLQTPQVLTVVAGAVITTLLAALVTRRLA